MVTTYAAALLEEIRSAESAPLPLSAASRQLVEVHLALAHEIAWWFWRRYGRNTYHWKGCCPIDFDDALEVALMGLVLAGLSWDGAAGGAGGAGGADFAQHARKEITAFIRREKPWRRNARTFFFTDLSRFNEKGNERRFDPAAPVPDNQPPRIPAHKDLQEHQAARVLWRWHIAKQDAAKIAHCENLPEYVVEGIIEDRRLMTYLSNRRRKGCEFVLDVMDFRAFAEGRVPVMPQVQGHRRTKRRRKEWQEQQARVAAELDAAGW